jgi:integrase
MSRRAGYLKKREDLCVDKDGKKYKRVRYRAAIPHPEAPPSSGRKLERTFATKAEAEHWLNSQQSAVRTGTFIDPTKGDTTLAEVSELWRATWPITPLAPKTARGYDSILSAHVIPRWGGVCVSAIDAAAVQVWVGELCTTNHAQTVHNIYAVMRHCMRAAVQHRLVLVNPCTKDVVKLPSKKKAKASRPEQLYLSATELRQLVNATPERWRLPLRIAGIVGSRAGEIWGLRRCDVDGLHGSIRVTYALKEVPALIAGPTKTYERRKISVGAELKAELAGALQSPGVKNAKGYAAIIETDDGPQLAYVPDAADPRRLVFTTDRGTPVSHGNFYARIYRPVVEHLWPASHRLHELRFHDLRHTSASLLLSVSGSNLAIVQKRLGHESIETTFNIYGHLLPEADQSAADALDRAYAEAESNMIPLKRADAS